MYHQAVNGSVVAVAFISSFTIIEEAEGAPAGHPFRLAATVSTSQSDERVYLGFFASEEACIDHIRELADPEVAFVGAVVPETPEDNETEETEQETEGTEVS